MHRWKLTFHGLCSDILQGPLGTIVAVHLKLQLLGGALRGEKYIGRKVVEKKKNKETIKHAEKGKVVGWERHADML